MEGVKRVYKLYKKKKTGKWMVPFLILLTTRLCGHYYFFLEI